MRVLCRVEFLSSCSTPRWQDWGMEAGFPSGDPETPPN